MNRNLLPLNEISRALVAINVSNLTALANASLVRSKQIADLVAFGNQIHTLASSFDKIQADHARLLSQFDVSRLIVADEVIRRLEAQISSSNRLLIRQMTFPAIEVAQQMLSTFAPTTQIIARFQAQLGVVTRLIDQSLRRTFEPLRELAERAGRTQAVCDAFLAYGLWLAPSMPEELVQKVVESHSRGIGSGTVHSLVSRYYAKSGWKLLDRVIEACENNPNLEQRCEPIRQALRAHREGLYAVTVPTLLLLVEGIATDYVKANNLMPKVGRKTTEIIVTALKDTPCSPFDVYTYAGVTSLLAYIENSMYIFVDFDQGYQRLLRERKLIAHAIRHGRQVSYGSRMNSLRLFLMIDVLTLLK